MQEFLGALFLGAIGFGLVLAALNLMAALRNPRSAPAAATAVLASLLLFGGDD
jgi:hypothetical protein